MLCFSRDESDRLLLTAEQVLFVFSSQFTLFEEQTLRYFSGYIFRRLLNFHSRNTCEICQKLGDKIGPDTVHVQEEDLFIALKRFSDEKSSLFKCSSEFVDYVRKVCQLVDYCFAKYLTTPSITRSLNHAVSKYVTPVEVCKQDMLEKMQKTLIRTLFLYKIKWKNSKLLDEVSSTRKLRNAAHV